MKKYKNRFICLKEKIMSKKRKETDIPEANSISHSGSGFSAVHVTLHFFTSYVTKTKIFFWLIL